MEQALRPEEIRSFERMLRKLHAHLSGDVELLAPEALGTEERPVEVQDDAADEWSHELSLDLLEIDEENLREVNEALERIQDGTYGRCDECGRAIARRRLRALPHARLCIQCGRKAPPPYPEEP